MSVKNNKKAKIKFDEMPEVIAQLVVEVHQLSNKFDAISQNTQVASNTVKTSKGRVVYSTDQVCEILHKTRGTIYRMVSRGELPGYKSGKYLVFFQDEIMDWLIQSKRLTAEEMLDAIDIRDNARLSKHFAL